MKIIETNNYQEMSEKAAHFLIKKVQDNPAIILGMATGGTPEGMYRLLIDDHKNNHTSYQGVTTFNLDEYIGLPKDDANSYYSYMWKTLFDHIDINDEHVHLPNGLATNIEEECKNYERLIKQYGGIDVQVLGIGENGHIGFNEPGTAFDSHTHVIELTDSTREANSRYFSNIYEVPKEAITMGIHTIMQAKEIVLLASGERKAEALNQLLHAEISEAFPASILQKHSNVTIIADRDALKHISHVTV
ncbi:glucosamine-6-phosphate deaminase [Alkalihalobacillus pseudalcaliphilus]|uniref:glucosamine-6-phosphate deaminase n=1 Tax=Alkalihalobacillus pseudalcaliphilus TaxID=79884 RepID=UPI00064DE023|nr:glucosamine-6-phosphate deaminase [Alkalihalobacillus pseudalcaliphilus]KMK75516.1 glucosamine-6-phosphate deaminase [Alkalihalobacillus pseudalcaliphilus]